MHNLKTCKTRSTVDNINNNKIYKELLVIKFKQ
jgi:hypothetical protein